MNWAELAINKKEKDYCINESKKQSIIQFANITKRQSIITSTANVIRRQSLAQFPSYARKPSAMLLTPFSSDKINKRHSLMPFVNYIRRQSIMVVKRVPKRNSLIWKRKSLLTEGSLHILRWGAI